METAQQERDIALTECHAANDEVTAFKMTMQTLREREVAQEAMLEQLRRDMTAQRAAVEALQQQEEAARLEAAGQAKAVDQMRETEASVRCALT